MPNYAIETGACCPACFAVVERRRPVARRFSLTPPPLLFSEKLQAFLANYLDPETNELKYLRKLVRVGEERVCGAENVGTRTHRNKELRCERKQPLPTLTFALLLLHTPRSKTSPTAS